MPWNTEVGQRHVMPMCVLDETQITRDILSYLYTHNTAQDTLEGIVEWWLLEQKIMRQTKQVKKVVEELVAQGLISSHTASDSKTHYQINKRKVKEIRSLIERENE